MRLAHALAAALSLACLPALAEPLTREQGDAILQELKSIRQLLERQQQAPQPGPRGTAGAPMQAPESLKVTTKGAATLGRPDAPVTMVAYMDYECPFCKRFETQSFPEIKKQYIHTGKVRYLVRDLPLDFHKNALKAAESTHCAGEQGKIWEMRAKLIEAFPRIESEHLVTYAGQLGLDVEKLRRCLDSNKYAEPLKRDLAAIQQMGISGTPTFVIGRTGKDDSVEGTKVVGAQPFASFDQHIKNLLK